MQEEWIGNWIMELAAEAAIYAYIYEMKVMKNRDPVLYQACRMDKWMQYRILRYIGEKRECRYKTVTFNTEYTVVEHEKLLYNEKENCNQFQAVYESLPEDQRPLMLRVMLHQHMIIERLGNGG